VSENVVFLSVSSWLRTRARDAAASEARGGEAEAEAAEDAVELLRLVGACCLS
jgi:hypothetical protein